MFKIILKPIRNWFHAEASRIRNVRIEIAKEREASPRRIMQREFERLLRNLQALETTA
jgi:hypothetical protein